MSLEQSKTVKEIDEAIFRVLEKVPIIKKKSDNDYYRSKYAEYPEIQKEVRPHLMAERLLFKSFPVEGNKLIYSITHLTSQEYYKGTVDLNAISVSPQAQGSAISYMKRYALVAVLDLIIEGDDDDGNSSSNAKPKQEAQQQKQAALVDNREWLNKDTAKWFDAKIFILANGGKLEKTAKKYRISTENAASLVKPEPLKPGGKLWPFAISYLAKDGNKSESISKAFSITDQDLQDLQVDALNSVDTPSTDINSQSTTTK